MNKIMIAAVAMAFAPSAAVAADYDIDPAHSFVEFRIQHLGYSWLLGRFNDISGEFFYDPAAPAEKQKISVSVDPASVDSNHAERDKHLRGGDFLDVKKYSAATFVSTTFAGDDNGGVMRGNLTIRGVTREVAVEVEKVGAGNDPWGGYRAGFYGKLNLNRSDYGGTSNLGPASETLLLEIFIEGVRR